MTEAEYAAFMAAERAAAKPGEWCDIHDDWQANCGQDADACWADEQESRRALEDEKWCGRRGWGAT